MKKTKLKNEFKKEIEFVQDDNIELWENKKYFPVLNKNMEKVQTLLNKLNVKRVIAFDYLTDNWKNWVCDEITLCVLPLCSNIEQNGNITTEVLNSMKIKIKDTFVPVDIDSDELSEISNLIDYFPTRNLLIARVNVFADLELFESAIHSALSVFNPKVKSNDEIWAYKMEYQWGINFNKRKEKLKRDIENISYKLEELKSSYLGNIKDKIFLEKELIFQDTINKELKNKVLDELVKVKKLVFVKNVEITDTLKVNIGDVYITDKVSTGLEKKDGIEVPILETKKVYIGNLTFLIKSNNVTVINPNKIGEYTHPHANDKICFGEAQMRVESFLASLELEKLMIFLYSWAVSINPSDWMLPLQEFYDKQVKLQNKTK